MNKIAYASQNIEPKTLPVDVCVFGRFGQLSPAAVHSADSWFDSGVKWWIYVLSIVTNLHKNSFSFSWNSCKHALNRRRFVVFDRLWANAAPTLNAAFSLTNLLAKWWIHIPSDIFNSCTIPRNSNLRSAKTNLRSVLVFSGTTAKFGWPERSVTFISVQQSWKSAYHFLTVVYDGSESK